MKPVKEHLASGRARVYAMSIDDETAKAAHKHKQATMKKRASKRAPIEKYPDTAEIVASGLAMSDSAGVGVPFDLDRLLATRPLREKLWVFINETIAGDADFLSMLSTNNQLFIFEHLTAGPSFFPSDTYIPDDIQLEKSADAGADRFNHSHAEGDPSSVFWAKAFRTRESILWSEDSDLISCFALLKDSEQPAMCKWYNGKELVDMPRLIQQCCASLGVTRHQFALACILSGTDYVEKGDFAQNFGCTSIFHALRNMAATGHLREDREELIEHFDFDFFLRHMYTEVFHVGRKHVIDFVSNFSPPAEDEETQAKKRKLDDSSSSAPSDDDNESSSSSSSSSTVSTRRLISASWSEIDRDYGNSNSYSVPTAVALARAKENIIWNYRFHCV